jgi:acyl-CoA reductase-like NAD-dependent aldehyde dehydrogenase
VPSGQLERVNCFISGEFTESESRESVDVVNPNSGKTAWSRPAGCLEDVRRAVRAARESFESGVWSAAPPSSRKRVLGKLATLIAEHAEQLDLIDATEMGKPIAEQFCNAAAAASLVRYYSEAIDKWSGDVFSSDSATLALQRRVPHGVVAAIIPWNFPTYNVALKIAPALAVGNSVVLKPSELASQAALLIARLSLEAGVPPGVLNVLPGIGEVAGRLLALHDDVDMITFTGSTTVGKLMQQYAGQSNMKRVMCECGGKSPQIVFADSVSLEEAANTIAGEFLINQGQLCSVGSRVLVQRERQDELVELLGERIARVRIGDAREPATTFGPLVSATQLRRVREFVTEAEAAGIARVPLRPTTLPTTGGGFFLPPAIYRDVPPSAPIAQEEIFGPVLSVIPFTDEREAVSIANGTIYGLVASVWTSNLSTAMRMARGIKSSVIVYAKAPTGEGAGHSASSEPARQSGFGAEGGIAGMESYARRQLVWISYE